ncbi:MAG: DUF91 domain-containing protein [Leptolyngbya sp. RL_3_1]|nr:DUF91 domain-containing protein [Leptolyngbya sp. RL_3_1]
MPQDIRLWKVKSGDSLQEIQQTSLNLEQRLHTWLERDISIISDDFLVIGSEVRTAYGGFIDLLCITASGDLVIVELKRGLTPREVVAQALDYASWAEGLSHEQITEIAEGYFYLKFNLTFEEVFEKNFKTDFPDTLNESHSILIVASSFDRSSERIINYLSKGYGVNINALTFQYFNGDVDNEFLGRVFLIEPTSVQQSSQSKKGSKRKPNLTREALREMADDRGLSVIYNLLLDSLSGSIFRRTSTTLSALVFYGGYSKSDNAVIFSLVVGESDSQKGLLFRSFTSRLAELVGVTEKIMIGCYPNGSIPWTYKNSDLPEWGGHQGYFQSTDDAQKFLSKLTGVIKHGS